MTNSGDLEAHERRNSSIQNWKKDKSPMMLCINAKLEYYSIKKLTE